MVHLMRRSISRYGVWGAGLGVFVLASTHAVPVAQPDVYSGVEDTPLFADAAEGLLANDSSDGGSLSVIQLSDVSHGLLSLQADGSFTYEPSPNFHGTDSFNYKLHEVGDQVFTIDSSQSRLNISASLSTSFGSDSASDASDVSGTLTVDLDPLSEPFSTIQITDLDATLTEGISLNFSFAFGLAGVNVIAQPGALTITMVEPGPPSAVAANGDFLQANNTTRVMGTVNVDGTGLADGAVTEGDQSLDVQAVLDFDGQILQAGNTLTLTTPIAFNGTFDVSGNTITLSLSGDLVATSMVQQPVESAPTSVILVVDPAPDPPMLVTDRYFMGSNDDVAVPAFLSGGGAETLVSTGVVWRYLDDGSDLGTAWRETGFDDTSWASGPAQLGYGDGDEETVIGFGTTTNKFITSYFRHRFTLADAARQGSLWLRLLRDDGAAVYLNGVEVTRNNLAANATFDTRASSGISTDYEDNFSHYPVTRSLLKDGVNVVAAEIHQVLPSSSDLSFQLELVRENSRGGVLANDEDADGDILTASLYRQAAHGVATVNADGSFDYTPNPGFVGVDSFIYQAVDQDNRAFRPLLSWGSEWAYLDDGSDPGSRWFASAFDDQLWARGSAELGYGDPDHTTVVGFIDTTPGDPGVVTKNATTYFRASCFVGNAEALENPTIRFLRDDAAAIYLNGLELYRDANLSADAGFNTFAINGVSDENEVVSIPIDPGRLIDGMNTVAVEVHQASASSSDMAFNLELGGALPPDTPIFGTGHAWTYLPDGSDQSNAWRHAEYDDSLWLSGTSKLGYGDGNEATTVPDGGATHPLTVYFRSTFEIADSTQVQALGLDLLRDDGAAVYINGIEVVRDALAPDAGHIDAATATTDGANESTFFPFNNLDSSVLVEGTNSIAVEVHQVSASSSDLGMDLRLRGNMVVPLGRVVIHVYDAGGFLDRDQDAMDDHWETIHALDVTLNDAALDADLDGSVNGDEYLAGTNPQDGDSVFQILDVARVSNDVTFHFPSVPGKAYRLQHTQDLDHPFIDIPGASLTASADDSVLSVALDVGWIRRYVRVVLATP
jgi:hypothetical protein